MALTVVLALAVAPAAAKGVVLGSPEYVPQGGGFGTTAPDFVSNGGVPSGVMTHIAWTGWGESTAHARATAAIYRPQGNYYPPIRVPLKVSNLGTCPGHPERAYRTLMFRLPQWPGGPLGSWRKWSGSRTICDYDDTDSAYDFPKLGPGLCATVGTYGEAGAVQSIATYKMECGPARRVAARISRRNRPFRCIKQGCRLRVLRMKCRLGRVRSGETTGLDYLYPLQRLSCRHGAASLSAFMVLSYD